MTTPSSEEGPHVLRFTDYEVDLAARELRSDGRIVPLQPRVFDLLACLLRSRDRVVTKDELRRAVWGDAEVSPFAVTQAVKALRSAVGDDGVAQRVIRTVRGRGYRLVAPVVGASNGQAPEASAGREAYTLAVHHLEQALGLLRELSTRCESGRAERAEGAAGSSSAHDPLTSPGEGGEERA